MRSNPVARIILVAAALTLLGSSAVGAQSDTQLPTDTRFPDEWGPTLLTAVVTSALDDAATNQLVEETVTGYQEELGGSTKDPTELTKKELRQAKNRGEATGGLMVIGPQTDAEEVTQRVLDITGEYKPNLMVVSGGDGQTIASLSRRNETTVIVDLGQPLPCVTSNGQPDPSGACDGSFSRVSGNYVPVEFAVEEAAFLAGVVAARVSRSSLGVISGYEGCGECERYVQGFINGARSVEPDIVIDTAYLSNDEANGFGDSASAKTFAEAFIDVYQPDVILPVGRSATPGMIEAAGEAGILAVGTGWDILATRPVLEDCVMASITKDTARGITDAMFLFSLGDTPSVLTYDLSSGGVALTDDWRDIATLPVDTTEFYQAADQALRSGEIEACPGGCGRTVVTAGAQPQTD